MKLIPNIFRNFPQIAESYLQEKIQPLNDYSLNLDRPHLKKVNSNLDDYSTNTNTHDILRSFEWGRTYMWNIIIPSAPPPFNNWFPALEMTPSVGTPTSYIEFNAAQGTYKVLDFMRQRTLRMQFIDTEDAILEKWLENWLNECFNVYYYKETNNTYAFSKASGVGLIGEISRQIGYCKLNSKREIIDFSWFLCYPHGEPTSINNSESGLRIIDISFCVVNFRKVSG